MSTQVDANRVIQKLKDRIAELTIENTVLEVQIEQLIKENGELTERQWDEGSPEVIVPGEGQE